MANVASLVFSRHYEQHSGCPTETSTGTVTIAHTDSDFYTNSNCDFYSNSVDFFVTSGSI
jgi:hypothetical protein